MQERHIISICSEFGISDQWLRTGVGDMYADEDAVQLESLSKRYRLTPADLVALRAFLKADPEVRASLLSFAEMLVAEQNAQDAAEAAAIAARDALIEQRDRESSADPSDDLASDALA